MHKMNLVKLLATVVLGTTLMSAQATRTWVSGVGDDANPCSRTAPCRTFAGAISKTAAGGEINALDPGGFGAVTITKSIIIDGGNMLAGVLVSGTNGIVVNAAPTARVVLRGLDINGIGTGVNGIRFLAGASLHVERCTIANFTTLGIDVTTGGKVFVKDTSLRGNAGGGIQIVPFTGNLIAGNPTPAGAPVCEIDAGTTTVPCPGESAVCQAPVVKGKVGPCRHCKTKQGVTTCSACAVQLQ